MGEEEWEEDDLVGREEDDLEDNECDGRLEGIIGGKMKVIEL